MKIEKIKPIPKYIEKKIKQLDKRKCPEQSGFTRYYAYFTKNDGELVKVTVAVKNKYKKWYCKQVAVHGVHSKVCFIKDIVLFYMGTYVTGWYSEGLTKYPKWYEDCSWGECDDKYFHMWIPIVNKEYISKFPEYKYSAYESYPYRNLLKYLRLYEQYPQTEYLVKMGLQGYAMSIQLLKQCKKDKAFCKWLYKNKDEIKSVGCYISTILTAYKTKKGLRETQQLEYAKKNIINGTDFKPIRNMLKGDYERYISYTSSNNISHRSYLDYLRACNYLNIDMSLNKNRYPNDFKRWHDIRIDEYNTKLAEEDERKRQALYEQFSSVAEKYMPLQKESKGVFICLIAKSPAELISEGNALHHCVGKMGYDQKFAREETLIFFIRTKEAPDVPLVTVEYSIKGKKVLQCYGDGDTKPNEEIQEYVYHNWLPYANRKLKKLMAAA